MAKPTPVLPLVGSTITPPGFKSPSRSAASIMVSAGRSLELPPGFIDSSFTRTCTPFGVARRLKRTSGVSPMRSNREFATRMAPPYLGKRRPRGWRDRTPPSRTDRVAFERVAVAVTDPPLDDADAGPADHDDQPERQQSIDEDDGERRYLVGTVGHENDRQAPLDHPEATGDERQRRHDLGDPEGE